MVPNGNMITKCLSLLIWLTYHNLPVHVIQTSIHLWTNHLLLLDIWDIFNKYPNWKGMDSRWFYNLYILFLGRVECAIRLFLVRSAWALSNGCKSLVSPNSGNYIAKSKGVHREVKSEGSWRPTSDLTNRNFIQGIWLWVRLLNKPKPYSYSERSV